MPGLKSPRSWGLFLWVKGRGLKKFNKHFFIQICELFPLLMFSHFFRLAISTFSNNLQLRVSYQLSLVSIN